jgi:hypothetical protein
MDRIMRLIVCLIGLIGALAALPAVFLQQGVAKLAKTAIEYPPMQANASFNLDAVKKKVAAAAAAHGQ